MNPEYIKDKATAFIKGIVEGANAKGAVVGISGGIDSAVVAYLCAEALGSENVAGVLMPSPSTPKEDIEDAREVVKALGIHGEFLPLDGLLKTFEPVVARLPFEISQKAAGNLHARLRMCILYLFANSLDYLVAGTDDASESFLGYFTKGGDGMSDFLPLGNLLKTEVRELGKFLGVPKRIIDKPSSPRLWDGQTAEGELGLTYEQIDKILKLNLDTYHKRTIPPSCEFD